MPANSDLTTLWDGVANAIRYKENSIEEIPVNQFASRIHALSTVAESSELCIYVSAPANANIKATHEDGTVYTGTADDTGNCTLWVDKPGLYTVTGTTSSGSGLSTTTINLNTVELTVGGGVLNKEEFENQGDWLQQLLMYLDAGSVGEYALFHNGSAGSEKKDVFAFDQDLTRISEVPELSLPKEQMKSFTTSTHNWFYGGFAGANYSPKTNIDLYDVELVHSSLPFTRYENIAGKLGDNLCFVGIIDLITGSGSPIYTIPIFSVSTLTRLDDIEYSGYRFQAAIAPFPHSLVVVGGGQSISRNVDIAIDENLTIKELVVSYPIGVVQAVGCSSPVGQYSIVCGGYNGSNTLNSSIAYDTNLTYKAGPNLSSPKREFVAPVIGNTAIIWASQSKETIDLIDPNLTASSGGKLNNYFRDEISNFAVLQPDRIISINTDSHEMEVFRFE